MKIAIVVPNNVWFCPYVNIYTEVLKKHYIPYDIISWNRDGKQEEAIQYNYVPKSRNPLVLIWSYKKYASFVKKIVKSNRYERLIVFTPQLAIFLCDYLKREFKNKYIFDYRDLSLEQKPYFKKSFLKILKNSYANVISSPGFRRYLPEGFDYLLSHNFNVEAVRKAIKDESVPKFKSNPIDVLTIGGIRDFDSNVQVIEHLANVDGFSVRFVGKGPSAVDLQNRAKELKATNISFEGYYPKEKEQDYVKEATFLNIYYPRRPSHDSAISNRFYNSLIYRKPMITTKNTTQGDYAEKYNIGVALENCESLPEVLKSYIASIDANEYCINSNKLLRDFLLDYEIWEKKVLEFVK